MRLISVLLILAASGVVSSQRTPFTSAERAIDAQMGKLRATSDAQRGAVTTKIAHEIRELPGGPNKVLLANGLANLSTEGDFGHATLQAVADTLSGALAQTPVPLQNGAPDFAYVELAQLAKYEHVKVDLRDPSYRLARRQVENRHEAQAKADFTLMDITGKSWTRSSLAGKVVVVNFWATWCPPCRKEMPDLEELYREFGPKGLVVLAISDETMDKVKPFVAANGYTFPILLDPGRKVNTRYQVQGIPNSFIYDRSGRLVAQAIDMRTRGQFLKLLAAAGLHEEPPRPR